jgi:hypothetical protein
MDGRKRPGKGKSGRLAAALWEFGIAPMKRVPNVVLKVKVNHTYFLGLVWSRRKALF